MAMNVDEILALSVAEKLELMAEIWDSIADSPDRLAATPETLSLLRERIAAHRADPAAGSSWPEVRERIVGSDKR